MLYLVFVLTFLCGILFYSLSPRDDQLKWDMHRAEGFIAGFLAQHQAAKDYIAAWLGVGYKHNPNAQFSLSKKTEVPVYLDGNPTGYTRSEFSFLLYAPKMVVVDLSSKQGETPNIETDGKDGAIQTSVFCLNSSGESVGCDTSNVSDVYLTSYSQTSAGGSGRPDWWPNENTNTQRRYESWRRAITHRTRGSYSCGVLTCAGEWEVNASRHKKCKQDGKGNQWCIDNGQTVLSPDGKCVQRVPQSIVDTLGCGDYNASLCSDAFFCISKIKNGPGEYYAPGLVAFYDGINNNNTGAEGDRIEGKDAWQDLIRTTDGCDSAAPMSTSCAVSSDSFNQGVDFSGNNSAYFYSGRTIKIPVQVGDATNGPFKDFTWTVLLGVPESGQYITFLNTGKFNLRLKNTSNEASVLVMKDGTQLAESQQFTFSENQVVSLTVIGSANTIKVYVNTDEILNYNKSGWSSADYGSDNVVISTPNANPEYIYGVRYYTRRLTVENRLRGGQIELSELAQNFNVDSKRYDIGKVTLEEVPEEGA